jgi:cell division septation protein DedD
MAKGPSPRDDASRRGREEPAPHRRRAEAEEAPWLDEGDHDDEGPTHTLIGRRTLWGILFLLAVLTVGVVVGITLVSRRDSAPIDVPAVGEEVPVLRAPGPWKLPPTGPDVDGVPVEGQGQLLFGTGDGRETDSAIALDAMPEDPLPKPGQAQTLPMVDEALESDAPVIAADPPARPRAIDTPAAAPTRGNGQTVQLGAFSSSARAREAFRSLSGRYVYLAGMEPLIVPVTTEGKTLYRLRMAAPSPIAARDICSRLKVAGEACSVVD